MFAEWVPDQSQKFETRCVGNFLEREDQRRQKILPFAETFQRVTRPNFLKQTQKPKHYRLQSFQLFDYSLKHTT